MTNESINKSSKKGIVSFTRSIPKAGCNELFCNSLLHLVGKGINAIYTSSNHSLYFPDSKL